VIKIICAHYGMKKKHPGSVGSNLMWPSFRNLVVSFLVVAQINHKVAAVCSANDYQSCSCKLKLGLKKVLR
jgi:hypothetical protein